MKKRGKLMNTIEEILKKKRKECKNCRNCRNRFNILDLGKTTVTEDNKAQCMNFEKCMQIKCKSCKNRKNCK